MLGSIASRRPSLRVTLWLVLIGSVISLEKPGEAQSPAEVNARLLPRRLPAVAAGNRGSSVQGGIREGLQLHADVSRVEPCSAELDALVDSWFSEPSRETVVTDVRNARGTESKSTSWLRSTSSLASAEVARRLLVQANREFEVGAWLSAETTAWEAVRRGAEAIDLAARERGEVVGPTALEQLQHARVAIREARDFSGCFGPLDARAIHRMALSHQTDVLKNEAVAGLTSTDASDRYLDHARVLLSSLARQSVEAAQGMDLLAAIHLRRGDAHTLPGPTSLCLRRAALQGQPRNASLASRLGMQLAELGLWSEARWALEHSLTIEPDGPTARTLVVVLHRCGLVDEAAEVMARLQNQTYGASRLQAGLNGSTIEIAADGTQILVPEIIELSPHQFAAISQPVIPVERPAAAPTAAAGAALRTGATSTTGVGAEEAIKHLPTVAAKPVAYGAEPARGAESQQPEQPGAVRRFLNHFKGLW